MMAFPDHASESARLYERAQRVMPGGNTRLTVYTAPYPIYIRSGEGCRIVDEDGNTYIDCINNMTALIHGHAHPATHAAIREQAARLVAVANPTITEIELAEHICERVAGVEQIRFLNSGSEAAMYAVRAARAYTGRAKVAKAEGAYHGSYDPMMTTMTSRPANWGPAHSPNIVHDGTGISAAAAGEAIVFPYNDLAAAITILEAHVDDLAAVVIDPVPSRMWYAPANPEFVKGLRTWTQRKGVVFVFDEVMSFRVGYGGAQAVWGVVPDITVFGKIIGGGMPVGAVGGMTKFMRVFDHRLGSDFVVHGGTYNANPVAMAAGLAALKHYDESAVERLNGLGERLRHGLRAMLDQRALPGVVQGCGSLTQFVPGASASSVHNHRDRVNLAADPAIATNFFRGMLGRGVMIGEGGALILSTAMSDEIVDQLLESAAATLDDLLKQGVFKSTEVAMA